MASQVLPTTSSHRATGDSALVRCSLPVALFLIVFAWAVPSAPSADFWWHLRSGEYILQTHTVPRTDPFSYSMAGKPWIAHEWLSEVISYAIYHIAGTSGMLLCFGALVTLAMALVYLRTREAQFPVRVLALLLAVWTAAPTFSARPQAFTLLCVAAVLYLLDRYRDTGRTSFLLPLAPITVLWVNLHGAYILGPVILVLTLIGAVADYAMRPEDWSATKDQIRSLSLALAACVAVVPLNPNGFRMYVYPLETLRLKVLQANIMEWRSPDFHLAMFYPFALMLFGAVAVMALSKKRPRPSELILFCVFAYATLRAMRNISVFALVAGPVLAKYLVVPEVRFPLRVPSKVRRLFALTALGVAIPAAAQSVRYDLAAQQGLEWLRFPKDAVSYIQQHQLPGRIFNSYDYGGYLLWRLYPQYRVYIDGRTDLYGDDFMQHFLSLYRGEVDPEPDLDRDHVRTVIIEPSSNLARKLGKSPAWKKVFEDDRAMVFTR